MRKSKYQEKIIKVLEDSKEPLTARIIHRLTPDSDLATIYRNINKLVAHGRITELRIIKRESLFEINKDNHQHAVCKVCGKVEHVEIDSEEILKNIKIKGFKAEDIEITIKGHCKK